MLLTKHLKDRQFYNTLMSIAIPITLQNLISSSLNLVDTIMVGKLGEVEIASVGLANQFFFIFILILFGLNSGASIFFSQFWGKNDIVSIRKILGIALFFGGIISFIFGSFSFFIPQKVLSLFTSDISTLELGSSYLSIVGLSYLTTAISFSYSFGSRSIGEAKLPMLISSISLLLNTVLNYILIFGMGFIPAMGVKGAALATLFSRYLEMFLLLGLIYYKGHPLAGNFKEMFSFSTDFLKSFFKTAAPVILNEGLWSVGVTMYLAAYARIGTEAIAAIHISNTVQNFFMVIAFGVANASTVMIGNEIGANKNDTAISYAKKFSIIGFIIGFIIGLTLFVSAPFVVSFFNISEEVRYNTIRILMVLSVVMSAKVFNTILIVGILRGGGDTKYSLLLDMGSVWLIGVPLAFIGALIWKLPIYWVVAFVSFEEILKAFFGIPRVISKKWVRNIIEEM
ncbi:MATE family efflux transporter [Serpentinicella alkaliphila]|uniref:Putative MATE family efflux protein n=1 Tax=Serpentinicella alkaliphila TaxID=1734049 RepID=A0A4R2TZD1_9FIRM|nr:MATE family efflux transporter [Serpentinicella alkaliphila]QUH24652.1 MATE family efflux transporter [Serpentinicella alkaliphila]TCQ03089.1 putative MATE family efflux protein [Serpentinicella alkaliphila]